MPLADLRLAEHRPGRLEAGVAVDPTAAARHAPRGTDELLAVGADGDEPVGEGMGSGIDGDHHDEIVLTEKLDRPRGAVVGEAHLCPPRARGRHRHAPGAVHDDRHRHRELAVLLLHLHRHRKEPGDSRARPATAGEREPAADHRQPPALLGDEELEGADEGRVEAVRGDVVENHSLRSGEHPDVNLGEIRHLLDLDSLSTEERGQGRGLVAGDNEDARAADDLDPAFGDVVARIGVALRKNADGIAMAPRLREPVGKPDSRLPVDHLGGKPGDRLAVARHLHRHGRIDRATDNGADDQPFAGKDAPRHVDASDRVVFVEGWRRNAEVERHAPFDERVGEAIDRLGGEAVGEGEEAGSAVGADLRQGMERRRLQSRGAGAACVFGAGGTSAEDRSTRHRLIGEVDDDQPVVAPLR